MINYSKVWYTIDVLRKNLATKNPKNLALLVSELASEHKAENIRVYEVLGQCDYADYFVVMSGTSTRHTQALAENILKNHPEKCYIEGSQQGQWILVDLKDVVVHIFLEEARDHYNFDKLWGHVPNISNDDDSSPQESMLMQHSQ